ncbi:hypothetical protein BO70DRAFT_392218 [Aspergillus heteromorphus CBS 117.55]|uniref:Zn(2)-C6 fungal-type domain-containing protein n=1 Tax=Aspergillus heteromorphus CBS 117.55 TaxID=1448321 RepID=A0A317X7I2_9EURO|nr:uncharacterized protein BO70DRAFT_392218 [Aspergillus heteromorphus CBS 117.55]PWY92838.1 hypothetical protein BO70DRAFT_392218 [Aspergillus heteromorphus CBS 117.55]
MDKTRRHSRNLRLAKACNTCRRKKVKCDGKRPVCSSCRAFDLECAYQDVVDRPNRASRAYAQALEQRIERLQEQLQRPNRSGDGPGPSMRGTSPSGLSRSDAVSSQPSHPENGEPLSEHNTLIDEDDFHPSSAGEANDQAYILNAQDGRMRYYGASSAFGAFSSTVGSGSENQTWTGAQQRVPQRRASVWPLTSWVPNILQDGLDRRISEPLPSRNETMQLVSEFMATFNQAIPLFDEKSFMRSVDRQYSWKPDDSASWWISLNIALAIAYKERTHASSDAGDNWKRSMGHVKNALNAVGEVFLQNSDLSAVQGLLGLALYFQGTPNPQALFMFAATAMRLAHSIGLHRDTASSIPSPEDEQRRRTYWIAFHLDADISIRVGRPPVQDTEDYDTRLPADVPHDEKGIITIEDTQVNFFRLLVQLSLVQRLVYRHLYTVTARRQPKEKLIEELKACEQALLDWKSLIPPRLQPQCLFKWESHYFAQHFLRLHLAYHCCYCNLYQACMFQIKSAEAPLRDAIFGIILRSLDSARSALNLRSQIPLLGSTYKWNVIYFPAAACVPLALRILAYPAHEYARTDLAMIRETLDFLASTSSEEPGTYIDFILGAFSDLEHSARQALAKAQLKNSQPPAPESDRRDIGLNVPPDGIRYPASHAGYNSLPISSGITTTDDMGGTTSISNLPGADAGFPILDTQVDSTANWQWLLPPFWNWQEFTTGAPSFL